jgi:hypothetical protein
MQTEKVANGPDRATAAAEASIRKSLEGAEAAMSRSSTQFWNSQDKVLDSMQEFANGWFERRHEGAHAAMDSALRMCRARNPAEAMSEYQTWARGALERTMADAMAVQKQMMKITGAATEQATRPKQR